MAEVQAPSQGRGPLLERDYWAVVAGVEGPEAVAEAVRRHFEEFPPPSLVQFRRSGSEGSGGPLSPGDELEVQGAVVDQPERRPAATDRTTSSPVERS